MIKKLTALAATLSAGLGLAGCGDVVEIVKCDMSRDPGWPTIETSDVIKVYAGSLDDHAPTPLAVIDAADKISQTRAFLREGMTEWYPPASTGSVSELVMTLERDGRVQRKVGVGINYLEATGCGGRIVLYAGPRARARLRTILFNAPTPAYLQDPTTPL